MKKKIKIESVPITDLKTSEYNPRRLTEEQEKHLTESVKRFNLVDPIIVNNHKDRKGVIIGGNQRYFIAKKLKYKEVPVIYLNLSLEQEKELNLRLNINTGEWNMDLLQNLDLELLLDVGFDDQTLSDIWDSQLEIENDGFNVEKEIETAKKTNIKIGDIFQLGNSRIICGDSTDPEVVKKLVGNEKIDTILCDPIYNINLNYNKGVGGKSNYGGDINDDKTDKEYKQFVKKTIENALLVSKPDLHCFYFCDQRYIWVLQTIYNELGIKNERVNIWVKNGSSMTPKNAFNKCYEPVIYGKKGHPFLNNNMHNLNEVLNKEVGNGNRTADDILDMIDLWLVKRLPGSEYLHPTQKPIDLYEKPLKRCSKPGQNVLDLFGGSGTVLLACEQMKRKAFLSEINPIFIQLIINRYEEYSNQKAIKLN